MQAKRLPALRTAKSRSRDFVKVRSQSKGLIANHYEGRGRISGNCCTSDDGLMGRAWRAAGSDLAAVMW